MKRTRSLSSSTTWHSPGDSSDGVAISIATGSLVERVARGHGLRVERHPIGFKHLSRALRAGTVDAAGEESGGFAWGRFSVDKDGIMAGAFFVEMLARASAPLAQRLEELRAYHRSGFCGRSAVPRNGSAERALSSLEATPPDRLNGIPVRQVETRDGIRFAFGDGFLMLRGSGTEPLVRIYAEAPDEAALSRRLAEGRELLAG